MIYRNLGNTSESVSVLGQGLTGTGGYERYNPDTVAKRVRAIRAGIDAGMSFIDTAELYGGGLGEEVAGEAIRGLRSSVFLASKFFPVGNVAKNVTLSLENSLTRLQTDYLDLYQVHWPNPDIPIQDIMGALNSLCEQGKTRYIGLSNFSSLEIEEARQTFPGSAIVSVQAEYNTLEREMERDLLDYCSRNGITIIAYSPLNQGRIFYDEHQKKILTEVARKNEQTVPQIILRWLVGKHPVIVMTKSSSEERVKENAASLNFDLDDEDVKNIDALRHETANVPAARIRISVNNQPVYSSVKDALKNVLNLIPSPYIISKIYLKLNFQKPLRLVPTMDTSGKYDYDLDTLNLYDGLKKYWGSVLAFGWEKKIPAYIFTGPASETTGQ